MKAKAPTQKVAFFMGTVLAIYVDAEENQKQRHINVLVESESVSISRKDLDTLSKGAMSRLEAENSISPNQIKDIVFLGIAPLGLMTKEEFYGPTPVAN